MFKYIVLLYLISPLVSSFKFTAPQLKVSEAPFWSDGSLYYCDMLVGTLNRYSYADDKVYTAIIPGVTGFGGFLVPIQNRRNQYLVGVGRKVIIVNWNGRSQTATKAGDLFSVATRTNVCGLLVSPRNDFYTGNYADGLCYVAPHQSVYGYLRNKKLKTFANDMGSSVGMVLVEATNTVYQVDSCRRQINSFKWNKLTGELHDERVVLRLNASDNAQPAGIDADTNGYLYVGSYGGGHVMKIDPIKRKIVEKIRLPTKYITGVSFGGPNSNILFVTTANLPMNFLTGDIGGALPAPAGSLFQIPLKVKGVRTYLPRL